MTRVRTLDSAGEAGVSTRLSVDSLKSPAESPTFVMATVPSADSPGNSPSAVRIAAPSRLPGLAEVLVKRLNEKVTTTAATMMTTSAMMSRLEFLRIQVSRSCVVGSWLIGSWAGVGVLDMLAPSVLVPIDRRSRDDPVVSPGSGDQTTASGRHTDRASGHTVMSQDIGDTYVSGLR